MAKTYEFSIFSQPAEFKDGFVSVTSGLSRSVEQQTTYFSGTLAQALAEMENFKDSTCIAPCVVFLSMKYRNDRKPVGFDAAKKSLDKPE